MAASNINATPPPCLRNLNTYESMLATSTCNVGLCLSLHLPIMASVSGAQQQQRYVYDTVSASLTEVWSRCVAERRMLQVRLVENGCNALGAGYELHPIRSEDAQSLLVIRENTSSDAIDTKGENFDICASREQQSEEENSDLLKDLQHIGTTALDVSKGSYHVDCKIIRTQRRKEQLAASSRDDDGEKHQVVREHLEVSVQVVLSLCHALSDGPGALWVARSFLEHLGKVVVEFGTSGMSSHRHPMEEAPSTANHRSLPLTDLQALILGTDYAANEDSKTGAFEGQDEFIAALARQQQTQSVADDDDCWTVLPPESMQNIPSDPGFGTASGEFIDCTHFSLTAQETSDLRLACRQHGTTVQGALVAVALLVRIKLLFQQRATKLPRILAAVQIPVNARSNRNIAGVAVDQDECLCGSAGLWHTAQIVPGTDPWELAKHSTGSIRSLLGQQPDQGSSSSAAEVSSPQLHEWLRRLFHEPATLPPYSLMASSIGVAPIEECYGDGNVKVNRLLFFGGRRAVPFSAAPPSQRQAVGTMVHAVTFREEFNCMVNWTSPGIAKTFAQDTAREMKQSLLCLLKQQ